MTLPNKPHDSHRLWLLLVGLTIAAILAATLSSGTFAMLGGIFRTTSTTDIDLQKGLVGWWKLDGNAKDASPYANDATSFTNVTASADRKGSAGRAVSFNGTGTNGIIVAHNASQVMGTKMSVATWVKFGTGSMGIYQVLLSKVNLPNSAYEFNKSSGNGLRFEPICQDGTAHRFTEAAGSLSTVGVWYHVVATFDAATGDGQLFVNGQSRAVSYVDTHVGCAGSIRTNTDVLNIGARSWAGSTNCSCDMDDTRLYNRVLSAAEASALSRSYDAFTKLDAGTSGLKAWWKMDGNGKDSTPYGNNGTVTGATPAVDRKGVASRAYSFASGNTFTVPHSAGVNGDKALTLAVWVRPTALTGFNSGLATIVQKRLFTENQPYSLLLGAGGYANASWKVTTGGDINGYVAASSLGSSVPVNTWTHIAFVRDETTARFYINGVQSGATSNSGYVTKPPVTNTLPLNIGGATSQYSGFPGSLDDFRMYDRALPAGEVMSLYKSYNSQISVGNLQKGLVGYWPMNGTPKDATPFSNNASEQGGAALSTDRKGRTSSAYSLNGTSAYLQLNNGSNYSFPDTTFSLSFWEKAANVSQGGVFVMANGAVGGGWGALGDGGLWLKSASNSQAAFTPLPTETTTLLDTKWHHIVYVVTTSTTTAASQNIQMYIDGVPSGGSFANNGQVYAANTDLKFGKRVIGNNWAGSLDEVRIYNRGLAADEVKALYAEYR